MSLKRSEQNVDNVVKSIEIKLNGQDAPLKLRAIKSGSQAPLITETTSVSGLSYVIPVIVNVAGTDITYYLPLYSTKG
jgi:hypothetical protein